MKECITIMPTMKEIEQWIFRKLQEEFTKAMKMVLEALDQQILHERDRTRYRAKEQRETGVNTVLGTVRFKRWLFQDRKTGQYVYLLDRMLQFEGRGKVSPHLEETAIAFASQGPSYRDSARRLEQLLGYPVLSYEGIRQKLIERAEQPVKVIKRRSARVLFVEADGLYTKLQRSKRRGMEHGIASVHEGWEKSGNRVRLRNKQYYLHTDEGNFWEGFGDFLAERYEMDEETWLVVNGDGASWIGECTSYFHRCIYVLDRFHVARELKRFLGHLPEVWRTVRQALAKQDADALLSAVEAVEEKAIPREVRKEWVKYKRYLRQHREHLRDYRDLLREKGIDTSGMRPMGSAEAQMRLFAQRTKGGGYSWSERGVRAMLRTMMRSKEADVVVWVRAEQEGQKRTVSEQKGRVQKLLKQVTQEAKGCIAGMMRILEGPKRSSPTGMALRALRGY